MRMLRALVVLLLAAVCLAQTDFADIRRSGSLPGSSSLKWKYHVDGGDIRASPQVAPNGNIIVSSLGGNLHSLNPTTGARNWKFFSSELSSSVAFLSDGTIIVGSNDRNVYAVTAAGVKSWTYLTGDNVRATPLVVVGDYIYIGSRDGYMYKLTSAGALVWKYQTGGAVLSSAAELRDGRIVFGSADKKVYCLSSAGVLEWTYTTDGEVFSSPAVGDTTIVIGSNDMKVYGLSMSGALKWSYTTGGCVSTLPAKITPHDFAVCSRDGYIYRFNADGNLGWSFLIGAACYDPAVTSSLIITGAENKMITAFSFEGYKQWQYEALGQINSRPLVLSDGTVVVGSKDGWVYALTV